ncbi:hypothetical protein D1007_61671 [Hordeum vulgare]|nr:hypothetical protein D1007_61671 [Hordeum vulgare]
MPEEDAAHLQRWKAHWLAEEGVDGERHMKYEKLLHRDAEALQLEEEEEERACLAAMLLWRPIKPLSIRLGLPPSSLTSPTARVRARR